MFNIFLGVMSLLILTAKLGAIGFVIGMLILAMSVLMSEDKKDV